MQLACDIGGTNGRVVAYPSRDSVEALGETTFKLTQNVGGRTGDFWQDYSALLRACLQLQRQYGSIEGVGLAVAGKVDSSRSTLETAGNLDHWSNHPFVEALSDDLEARVVLGNDAEALALAEAVYGLGQNEFPGVDFMGMIWGAGVGGCCVRYRNGQFVTIPAEPGHQCIVADGNKCGCGQLGCLEAYVGGSGIRNHFGKPAEELTRDEWMDVAAWMAHGLRGVLTIQPSELIVFSGGVACKQGWLLELLEERLTHPMLGSPKLRVSAFGESAGTLGALSLLSL